MRILTTEGSQVIFQYPMRKKGLEPLRPFGHQLLRLARLPIPPLPRRLARTIIQGESDPENNQINAPLSDAINWIPETTFPLRWSSFVMNRSMRAWAAHAS